MQAGYFSWPWSNLYINKEQTDLMSELQQHDNTFKTNHHLEGYVHKSFKGIQDPGLLDLSLLPFHVKQVKIMYYQRTRVMSAALTKIYDASCGCGDARTRKTCGHVGENKVPSHCWPTEKSPWQHFNNSSHRLNLCTPGLIQVPLIKGDGLSFESWCVRAGVKPS